MASITLLPPGMGALEERQGKAANTGMRSRMVQAYQAVIQENRAAAVDTSDLSLGTQTAGQFQFDFTGLAGGAAASISWEGAVSANLEQGEYTTSFSFAFKMSLSYEITLADGISADANALAGPDFSLSSDGQLTLAGQLAQRTGAGDATQLDLAGTLSDGLLAALQKLGLLDSEGRATPALQLFSDYAGLHRFTAGQQVSNQQGLQYSQTYKSNMLSWQSWNQRTANQAETAASASVIDFLPQVTAR